MKTMIALSATAIALAALAGQAQGAASPEQRIAALERQVATLTRALPTRPQATPADRKIAALQKRATALEKRVKKLEAEAKETTAAMLAFLLVSVFEIGYTQCLTAVTADAFAGTWNVVDQIAQTAQAKTYFGPQPVVTDSDACTDLKITRQQTVPPSVAPFSALTALIQE
jgi:Na+-translocating ferredoxin:NAD+ oxidoreductase RNF subunit RnfB